MTTQKTTTGNPFLDFDMAKVMADFDPTKFAGEFAKMAKHYQTPTFDLNAVFEAQRIR